VTDNKRNYKQTQRDALPEEVLEITGLLDFVYRTIFSRTQGFGKWISFPPQVKGWETSTLWSPLERGYFIG
jgi:hypothetical protein